MDTKNGYSSPMAPVVGKSMSLIRRLSHGMILVRISFLITFSLFGGRVNANYGMKVLGVPSSQSMVRQ